ncbi:MAG: Gfo/Idh/MocA family oxidoreductase [Bacteroidota bacterium]|nr:Gfo/Idh/MocA family oxidoreductase [Bacteroidota bacterium]
MEYSRRKFLHTTGQTLAGASLMSALPWDAIAASKRKVSQNDRINVGVIGANGMGWSDAQSFMKIPEANVMAICDVDQRVIDKRVAEVKEANMVLQTYNDYRRLLENKDIDVVIIGTPDHWHCLQMTDACAAGKDVYVEKPVGNSIAECAVMVEAQKKYNRAVQCGQWQRSMPHFIDALNFLKSGKIGQIRTVKAWAYMGWMKDIPAKPDTPAPAGVDYNMWLGPAQQRPFNENRFHFNFRWFWDYAGGLMTDWGVHLVDYVLLGMDAPLPKSVYASGGKYAYPDGGNETPDTLAAVYDFGNFTMLWEHAQGISNGNYGRDHGIAYIGNNGTLVLDRGGWEVIADEKRMEPIPFEPNKGSGLDAHTQNFINVVKSRKFDSLTCPITAGAHVANVCQMGNISFRTGEIVHWNNEKRNFRESDANKFLAAGYHNDYKMPKV